MQFRFFFLVGCPLLLACGGSSSSFSQKCGNSVLEPTESCDDGNTLDGDGCSALCLYEDYCGNGEVEGEEACDDHNTLSGDGCIANCSRTESCGNGLRDLAAGEVCDGQDYCAQDCLSRDVCSEGAADASCTDDNNTPWDGCGKDCLKEHSFIINTLQIASAEIGCDYSGDGVIDNAFARALGDNPLQLINTSGLKSDGSYLGSSILFVLHALGLDDPSALNDSELALALFNGIDGVDTADGNLDGNAPFLYPKGFFDEALRPEASINASIVDGALSGGPEFLSLTIPILSISIRLDFERAFLNLTTTRNDQNEVNGLEDGLLCGVLPIRSLADQKDSVLLNFLSRDDTRCDNGASRDEQPYSLADILVAGAVALTGDRIGLANVEMTEDTSFSAYVDIDGDGLERFEIDRGDGQCQAIITRCFDGDGSEVKGDGSDPNGDCALNPAIADGVPAAVTFSATTARIVGEAP
ncbi:MAG: DUF4215 domain-containing protein [Myxococcales bacterium]|nr:MAG: DUF4215 domain-containing protein [Myxococcales bacterium]